MHWFPDHEAVSALLRVSPNQGDGTLSGAMGDISRKRPSHMAEDAVRAVELLPMSKMKLNCLQVGEGLQLVNAALR